VASAPLDGAVSPNDGAIVPSNLALRYEVGSSVTSVELLLDARTAAEGAALLATRQFVAATSIDGPIEIVNATPGPANWDGARKFVVEARSGVLGALLVESRTIGIVADLIMGGRGVESSDEPSELEVDLFTQRALGFLHTLLDAVAPARPEPIALTEREYPTPARSIVVLASVTHRGEQLPFHVEVLAHHVADDQHEIDDARMQAICQDVPLELNFKFSSVQLKAEDVSALEPGDVICLEHDLAAPLVGMVSGKPMMRGRVGVSRRRAAIEVTDLIDGNH
jgi:flagellar motor switch/type III secretory pathway protein FliN